jgi:hypothetical protein
MERVRGALGRFRILGAAVALLATAALASIMAVFVFGPPDAPQSDPGSRMDSTASQSAQAISQVVDDVDSTAQGEALVTADGPQAAAPLFWSIPPNRGLHAPELYVLARDDDIAWKGSASASLRARDVYDPGKRYGAFEQILLADAYRGRRVRLSAFMRTRRVAADAGGASLFLRVEDAANNIAFQNMEGGQMPRGDTEWQEYSIVLYVPRSATEIHFGAFLRGPGQLWVDEMRLEIAEPRTPLTGDPGYFSRFLGGRPLHAAQARVLAAPANLGFEAS